MKLLVELLRIDKSYMFKNYKKGRFVVLKVGFKNKIFILSKLFK